MAITATTTQTIGNSNDNQTVDGATCMQNAELVGQLTVTSIAFRD
jgi:hypothetical protein